MGYKTRTVTCTKCGRKMVGRHKPNPPWRCFECGIKASTAQITTMAAKTGPGFDKAVAAGREVQRQIAAKSGPLYDRWRAGMNSYLEGTKG